VTPPTDLSYMNPALDDNASAGSMANAMPMRVRLGLGGNTTAGSSGYPDPTTSAAFTWETAAANTAAKVRFGTGSSDADLTTVQSGYSWTLPATTFASAVYMHEVDICGLQPGKTYYYQVGGGAPGAEIWSATQSFTTLPDSGSITVSMSGDARDDVTTWQLANEHIKQLGVQAMLFTGDLILTGADESEYTQWIDAVWQDPNNPGGFLTFGELMFLPVAGNHEYSFDATADHFLSAFAYPGSGPYAKTFGSFNIGNAHFVYIDDNAIANAQPGTDYPEVDAQLAWLDADLTAANADRTKHPFIFAFSHRGLFSTSNHASDSDVLQARTTLAPIYAKYKVDAVFNGHDHEYERTVPIVPGSPVTGAPTAMTGGTTYIICAGVGAGPYLVGTTDESWRAAKVPFGQAANGANNYIGVYQTITLSGNTATIKAYGLQMGGNDPVIDTVMLQH
jgi:3',5'-cyclic AMP phosphodiesterase CpdA